MLSAVRWGRSRAPREIGDVVRGAINGFVAERIRHRG